MRLPLLFKNISFESSLQICFKKYWSDRYASLDWLERISRNFGASWFVAKVRLKFCAARSRLNCVVRSGVRLEYGGAALTGAPPPGGREWCRSSAGRGACRTICSTTSTSAASLRLQLWDERTRRPLVAPEFHCLRHRIHHRAARQRTRDREKKRKTSVKKREIILMTFPKNWSQKTNRFFK